MGCLASAGKNKKDKLGPRYYIKQKRGKGIKMIDKVSLNFSLGVIKDSSGGAFDGLKIKVSQSLNNNSNFSYVGETEFISPGINDFTTIFNLDYNFETYHYLEFSLIDMTDKVVQLIRTSVGEIIGSRENTRRYPLAFTNNSKELVSRIRKISDTKKSNLLRFEALVENVNNSPGVYYIKVYNKIKGNKLKKVFKTHEGNGSSFLLDMEQINHNDLYLNEKMNFYIELRQFNLGRVGIAHPVCFTQFPLKLEISEGQRLFRLELKIEWRPSIRFVDYLERGLQISFQVGIDFTGSNGDPSSEKSLHYIGNDFVNQYEQAIRYCGGVITSYDYDKQFPVYSFGGFYNEDTSHCYPLNHNLENPNVFGLDGIINCYKNGLKTVKLSGPTYFGPLILTVVDRIKSEIKSNKGFTNTYNILLILTDGAILDMEDTTNAIIKATKYPISIIIVGIGNSPELKKMEILDGDGNEILRNNKGKKASRDIVQFVALNDFKNDLYRFSDQLLCEIPYQIEEYFNTFHSFKK